MIVQFVKTREYANSTREYSMYIDKNLVKEKITYNRNHGIDQRPLAFLFAPISYAEMREAEIEVDDSKIFHQTLEYLVSFFNLDGDDSVKRNYPHSWENSQELFT